MTREEKRAIRLQRAQDMAHLLKQGLSMQAIGTKYGITRERVRQLLGELGLTAKDSGKRAFKAAKEQAKRDAFEMRIRSKWGVSVDEWRAYRKAGVVRAFESQRQTAGSRGIAFKMTFVEWLAVWLASGKLDQRGRGRGHYCMSRLSDAGAYEVGNVHIQPCEENSREATKQWIGKTKQHRCVHLLYPGASNPYVVKIRRKSIGAFPTLEAAIAARDAYLEKHSLPLCSNGVLGSGKGYQVDPRCRRNPYQVVVRGKNVGRFPTPEQARAAYLAECERIKAEQSSSLASVSTLVGREFPGAVSDQVAGAGSFIRGDELIHGSSLFAGPTVKETVGSIDCLDKR